MRSKICVGIVAVLGLALVAWAGPESGKNVWVTEDDEAIVLGEGHGGVMLFGEGEGFDLSDLKDGETRVFGSGDQAVTATRSGDEVTISRPATNDDSALSIVCRTSTDECRILGDPDDPDRTMIMVRKVRKCVDGEGDCEDHLTALDLGDGATKIVVRKTVECDDDGSCTETESTTRHGDAESHAVVQVMTAGGKHADMHGAVFVEADPSGRVFTITTGGGVTLRCPEGDATLRVEPEEADQVYLCPKHSVPLEKVEGEPTVHEIMIRKKADRDDD